MKFKTKVSVTTTRYVNLYRYKIEGGMNIKTNEILETRKVEKETILFSGSDDAYKIWKRGHYLPLEAKIERISRPDFSPKLVGKKYNPQESFAQDSIWLGNR